MNTQVRGGVNTQLGKVGTHIWRRCEHTIQNQGTWKSYFPSRSDRDTKIQMDQRSHQAAEGSGPGGMWSGPSHDSVQRTLPTEQAVWALVSISLLLSFPEPRP